MTNLYVLVRRFATAAALTLPGMLPAGAVGAQAAPAAAAPASAAGRQRGTVKTIAGSTMTLTTDDGHDVSVAVAPNARILQLPPGSTDLKSAQTITLGDVTVGDRVLVLGAAGAGASSFQAGRVILMKSTDIAAQHAREEADWQRRGSGGMVTATDAATGTVSISARARTVEVRTMPSTIFRRYAGDSVRFEDAKPGTLGEIQVGDQIRVRGTRSADGASIAADEIVTGRFENLSGTLTAVDASAGTVTLRDLGTKKSVMVNVTANSAIHTLPAEAAASLAGGKSGGTTAGGHPGTPSAAQRTPETAAPAREAGRRSGGDLSQMVAHLPLLSLADLHVGDAVLLVATPASTGTSAATAITLVSGVQALFSAAQGSAPAVTLSPWSLGQEGGEGAGAQ